jgi:hypothetical protein
MTNPPKLDADDVLTALKECDPAAFISEQERDWFVIDGKFDLSAVAARLSERLQKRSASRSQVQPTRLP